MHNNVLIISSAEGFLIKGLQTKLKGINITSSYAPPKVKEIELALNNTDVVFIFTDDTIDKSAEAWVYLKDKCNENDENVIVIGTDEEYEMLNKYIPNDLVYKYFRRPINMEEIINEMERFVSMSEIQERKKSILIVDDDVSYMSMISSWLKDEYRISMVNSGVQAITWLAKNQADLILLDYEMPVTTGPQVLEMIRSDSTLAHLPVMFLTGKGDKESIMKVLSLKPVGYQLKNVDKATLRENIANYFASEKAKV